MTLKLSSNIREAIHKILDDVENHHGILNAYKAANRIRKKHPEEDVTLDDIVKAIITGGGGVRAIEFDPHI